MKKAFQDPIDILGKRQSGTIDKLLDGYMSKFTVYKADTLFEPDYTLLKENRCILCGNKLKIMRDGKKAYCNSKKHRRNFVCDISKLK